MPAIINSAPDCVVHKEGYDGDDIADFILRQQLPGLRRVHDVRPGLDLRRRGRRRDHRVHDA